MRRFPILLCLIPFLASAEVPAATPETPPVLSPDPGATTGLPIPALGTGTVPASTADQDSGVEIPRVRLLHCDSGGASFEVTFPEVELNSYVVNGKTYTRISLLGATTEDLPGTVGLPLFRARLWVPPGATPVPTATVHGSYGRTVENPLPAPRWVEVDQGEITSMVPVYEGDPSLLTLERPTVELSGIETVRGWRLAHILLRPVTHSNGRLTGHRRVRVEVSFLYPAGRPSPNHDTGDSPWALDLARSLAPNFAYARDHGWRIEPPPPRTDQLDSGQLPLPRLKIVVSHALEITPEPAQLQDRMYEVTPADLSAAGVDPATVDPRRLTLYASSGKMLNLIGGFQDEDPLDLIPILVTGEDDESFDEGDALYFWGHGNVTWQSEDDWSEDPADPVLPSYKNLYSVYSYYWLVETDDPLRRFDEVDASPDDETSLHYLQGRLHYEKDLQNLARYKNAVEGMDFYFGESVDSNGDQTISYDIFDHDQGGGDARLALRFKATYLDPSINATLRVYVGSSAGDPDDAVLTTVVSSMNKLYEVWGTIPSEEMGDGNNYLTFELTVPQSPDPDDPYNALIYIDAFDVIYTRGLRVESGTLEGWGPDDVERECRMQVTDVTGERIVIWDLTRGKSLVNYDLVGPEGSRDAIFCWDAAPDCHLVVADLDKASGVLDVYLDVPSDLHSPVDADLIYIAHPDLIPPLAPLVEMHRTNGLRVEVVRVDDIYDEYSGGRLDPAAIRNYLYHAFTDYVGDPFTFVTLVGDATYDYRDAENRYEGPKWRDFPQAMLPAAYLLDPSTIPYFVASDNYYATLSEDEDLPQVALTRLSARESAQIETVVEKLIAYPELPGGDWQTTHVLLTDNTVNYDGDPPGGSRDEPIYFDVYAEVMLDSSAQAGMFHDKVYMTALGMAMTRDDRFTPYKYDLGKRRWATREHVSPTLWESLRQGELVVSFIGHGAWHTWTHELAETNRPPLYRDIEQWDCPFPPLLIQSSCSVADFDRTPSMDPDCMSELLLRHPQGCIATVGSSRTAGGMGQDVYHRALFEAFYHPDTRLDHPAFGLAHMQNLIITDNKWNRIRQTMFGDSASELRRAEPGLTLDPPQGVSVARGEVVTVSGGLGLESPDGPVYSGTVEIKAYDRPYMPHTYNDTRIYRLVGKSSAELVNGVFTTQLALPLGIDDDICDYDILPSGYDLELRAILVDETTGKTLTCSPFSGDDVWSLRIVGSVDPPADNEGPIVNLYFDDGATASGDLIDGSVKLTAELSDPHGILIARSDGGVPMSSGEIDRPIILVAEADTHNFDIDLTDNFRVVPGDFRAGVIERQLELPPGDYTLTLYCYDNFGEPGSASAELIVADGLNLSEVLVVPNPAPGATAFTFLSSTLPDQVRIRIYTPIGRLIKTLETTDLVTGFNVVEWDGTDANGRSLANGVYLYSLEARAGDDVSTVFEKFIMLR